MHKYASDIFIHVLPLEKVPRDGKVKYKHLSILWLKCSIKIYTISVVFSEDFIVSQTTICFWVLSHMTKMLTTNKELERLTKHYLT